MTSYEEKMAYILQGSPVARELLEYFGRGPLVIVDCGACDGLDSIIYSRLFDNAKIHAIEPRLDNYAELLLNIKEMHATNILPRQVCLSDKKETVTFYVSYGDANPARKWNTGNKSSSILKPTGHLNEHRWCRFTEDKMVTVRFDSLGIDHVDYVHLDVQGAELKVLEGFGKVLDTVRAVWLEVANMELYAGQPLVEHVDSYMSSKGFRKVKDTCRKYGDQLWVK